MDGLKKLEQKWIEVDKIRDEGIRSLTLQDAIEQFRLLYQSLAPILEETEALFRPERENYLNQLQRRLNRLNHLKKDSS